ncbi:glutathione S-transferase family protein [Roseomonas elaeocarpi]|uniref:Glutathione S-transferase family protein n=1 Tax=Roseomonas elaeocarpi TaxID=907779 RepID=A0ABV6JU02_9PROT
MITVHHLNDSRSHRILWLLEELGLPYELRHYQRLPNRLAPPELLAVSPLGKSPVITDDGRLVIESGAIIDYIIRRHGGGRLQPDPASAAYDDYVQWLHYAEGSAILPLILHFYALKTGDGAAPIRPRIADEVRTHLGYLDRSLEGRSFLLGETFSGADVQMSFVGGFAGVLGLREPYPALTAWVQRLHERPAFQRAVERGGSYSFGR